MPQLLLYPSSVILCVAFIVSLHLAVFNFFHLESG